MSFPHVDPQAIGSNVLFAAAVDGAREFVFCSTRFSAGLRLQVTSKISKRVHACQDCAAVVGTRNTILGLAFDVSGRDTLLRRYVQYC